MKTFRKILICSLFIALVSLVVMAGVWHFWITFWSLIGILNAVLGFVGASVLFSKFFKRKLDWETIGLWAACLFFGTIVFIVAWNYKPRYITV